MTDIVRIPSTVKAAPQVTYGGHLAEPSAAWAKRAAIDSRSIRNLTPEARLAWSALAVGGEVKVDHLTNAIVETLAANATRKGQSMARRAANVAVTATWEWLKNGAPVPQSRHYGVGIPATVTVHNDGTVSLDLDLSDLGRVRDLAVWSDERDDQIAADAQAIDNAVADGSITITPGIAQVEPL